MDPQTVKKLLDLNRQFYQTFALQFSATRQRLQSGVKHTLEAIPQTANILDLGCGNGGLARALAIHGQRGKYLGLDFSPALLEEARRISSEAGFQITFSETDLSLPDWDSYLVGSTFDVILAFAVLHHLPGISLRRQVMQAVRKLLAPGGRFYHSEWQFLNSERLKKRILPWETLSLSSGDVDENDYLLDWRQGGLGLRYVHHFNLAELQDLADASGFCVDESFYSDGEGGRLSLYQTWN